jgi:peptidoglycan hydrolase-like amidase
MAKEGYGYTDILTHYYPGTQLKSWDNLNFYIFHL